ncbi:IclR family transcriptional regulator [Alicyclobacillus sp.]|uniref:IclR family transcriptional regulator n=1 Tax=Alicyclobacillus sp. TaxID=61169 RepID=UPI0025C212F1|nr:IclR family transcriptional regulator [Alicyclobacillus sp.]MCL6517023.1 IclR family transcriptional regulator [Alicyclobacillus sp.]
MPERTHEQNQVLQKTARILDYVSRLSHPRPMHRMAKDLGIARSTLYRLLDAMETEGLLLRANGTLRIGPRVIHWAAEALNQPDITRVARPSLERLAEATGLTASVHVRMGHSRVCVDRVDAPAVIRPHVRIGESLPLHVGASGKILLAWLSTDARQDLVAQSFAAFPSHPVVTREADFQRIREQGFAVSLGERDDALASLSAPVFGPRQALVGALSISGVRHRFVPDVIAAWRDHVMAEANLLSTLLGGNPGHRSESGPPDAADPRDCPTSS